MWLTSLDPCRCRRSTVIPWPFAFLFLLTITSFLATATPAAADLELANDFPSLDDTVEMAALSLIVYDFRNEMDDTRVCDAINRKNYTIGVPDAIVQATDIECHWYHHSHVQGTQVMIVSSRKKRYNAIVFAGTDDARTALTDVDIRTSQIGDGLIWNQIPDDVRVHAGFNNAVFKDGLFFEIQKRFDAVRAKKPSSYRLFTTGHSLGAAEALLIAVGLTLQYEKKSNSPFRRWIPDYFKKYNPPVTSINFGCPRTGNNYWREFMSSTNPSVEKAGLWKIVLGWDLVPRLPDFFSHVGHTIQVERNDLSAYTGVNATAQAYYEHYGDTALGYAGVPFGWFSKPYIWVPGSIMSHHIERYWRVLHDWASSSKAHRGMWPTDFVHQDDVLNDDKPPNVDDDFWVNPPDDDAFFYSENVPIVEKL